MLEKIKELVIQKKDIDTIIKQSYENLPKEACGLIGAERLSNSCARLIVYPVPNKSNRVRRFFITYKEVKKAKTQFRLLGYQLCGCYHSHTEGYDVPSRKDKVSASQSTLKVWIIYSVKHDRFSIYNMMSENPIKIGYRIE